jgi:hypothetical protein
MIKLRSTEEEWQSEGCGKAFPEYYRMNKLAVQGLFFDRFA